MKSDGNEEPQGLRIAMFTEAYQPILSGVAVATQTLVEGLRRRGHVVDLYAPQHPGKPGGEEGTRRLPAINVPRPGWIPISLPLTPLAFEDIASQAYDIVHTQHPFLLGTTARALARRQRCPLVATIHTQYEQYVHYWAPWKPPGRWIVRRIVREFCNDCDHVITVADGMGQMLRDYGVTVPVSVIPNDLDMGRFLSAEGAGVREALGLAPDEVFLLNLGRMAPEKNLTFLVKALDPLLRSGKARLVLVGDGTARADLQALVASLDLSDRVIFTGARPHQETPDFYAAADIFVMASVTEVNPLTLGEALAAGTPVVAVDCFSSRDALMENRTGFLTPHKPGAFLTAVEKLVEDAELRRQMGHAARENARQRHATHAVEKTEAVYKSLLCAGE